MGANAIALYRRGFPLTGPDPCIGFTMSGEQDNALTFARLEGDRAAVRADMQALGSRIDVSLVQLREDMAKREVRMAHAIAVMIGLAIAILGLIA